MGPWGVYVNEMTQDEGWPCQKVQPLWLEGWSFEPHDKKICIYKTQVSTSQQESAHLNWTTVHIILSHLPFPASEFGSDFLSLSQMCFRLITLESQPSNTPPPLTFTYDLQQILLFTTASESEPHNYLVLILLDATTNPSTSLSELFTSKLFFSRSLAQYWPCVIYKVHVWSLWEIWSRRQGWQGGKWQDPGTCREMQTNFQHQGELCTPGHFLLTKKKPKNPTLILGSSWVALWVISTGKNCISLGCQMVFSFMLNIMDWW